MVTTTTLVGILAIATLVALSAFFSSAETAIFSLPSASGDEVADVDANTNATDDGADTDTGVTDDSADTDADDGEESADGRAARLAHLRADPHRLLVTILVGNNIVNAAVSSIATALLVGVLPTGQAVTVATVVVASVVLVFGEIVPKAYGLGNAERWSLVVAGPLRIVELVLWPIVTAFDAVTVRMAAAIGGDGDVEEPYL